MHCFDCPTNTNTLQQECRMKFDWIQLYNILDFVLVRATSKLTYKMDVFV